MFVDRIYGKINFDIENRIPGDSKTTSPSIL